MILKKPKLEEESGLQIIEATDKVDDLLEWVSGSTWVGQIIGDVYTAYTKGYLTEWTSLQEADEQIPYDNSPKKQTQVGYRLWWLSRHNTPTNIRRRVYNGCWFDKKVKLIGSREHIRFVKLSKEAQRCFTERKDIFETIYG